MNKIPAFYFDVRYLKYLVDKHKTEYLSAEPYNHVVIDNFLPKEIANLVYKEFPKVYNTKEQPIPWRFSGPGTTKKITDKIHLNKLRCSDENFFGPLTRHLMMIFNSFTFLMFLEGITGIKELITDPSFGGCGLHTTGRGGKLMIHVDCSRHPNKRCDQMLNMLLFLNKNWKEDYGGDFELWSLDGKQMCKKVAPVFNRLVLFNTGTNTFHGHPYPINCPENMRRNSLSVYYYVIDRQRDKNYLGHREKVYWRPVEQEDFDYIEKLKTENKIKTIKGVPHIEE